jgi:hypothetical protein
LHSSLQSWLGRWLRTSRWSDDSKPITNYRTSGSGALADLGVPQRTAELLPDSLRNRRLLPQRRTSIKNAHLSVESARKPRLLSFQKIMRCEVQFYQNGKRTCVCLRGRAARDGGRDRATAACCYTGAEHHTEGRKKKRGRHLEKIRATSSLIGEKRSKRGAAFCRRQSRWPGKAFTAAFTSF